jgi:hypothetical protein
VPSSKTGFTKPALLHHFLDQDQRPTVKMLKSAYPDGKPDSDYFAVLYVLKEHGSMSDRVAATVIAGVKGGRYTRYYYDVAHALPNKRIKIEAILGVMDKLMPHGYTDWLKEQEED